MDRIAEIHEGLSRAVTGGIVTNWSYHPPNATWMVATADGRTHQYNITQAHAFVDAVFAVERVWPR